MNETVSETPTSSGNPDTKTPSPSVQEHVPKPAANPGGVSDQATVPVQERHLSGIALMIVIGLIISAGIIFISRK